MFWGIFLILQNMYGQQSLNDITFLMFYGGVALLAVVAGFYLQHDLTLQQFALIIGTNRTYLGAYFTQAGTIYNAYINQLRIEHFKQLYMKAVAISRNVTARQLASESGYRSYSTFSLAFKQYTGQSVTAWMRTQQSN
jgi:AraC-like DNA-binding protein